MISCEYVKTMARYNAWMNQRLYAVSASLSDQELRVDRGAYFQSIFGTLEHLVRADLAWKLRFEGRDHEVAAIAGAQWPTFVELRRQREALDAYFLQWSSRLSAQDLQGNLSYVSVGDGLTRTRPVKLLLMHLFNHQTHHRGQVCTLLTQRGLDVGVTDLSMLPPE